MRAVQSSILNAISVSPPVVMDARAETISISIAAIVSTGATLTCHAEFTLDDVFSTSFNPSTANWFPVTGLSAVSTNTFSSTGFPVSAIRLNMTAWTSGNAYLRIIQSDGAGM